MAIEALIDIKDFLPDGITPIQNGIITANLLRKIHCGGTLYIDAARSWLAMVRAASTDGVFLSLNHPAGAYRDIIRQRKMFADRFVEIKDASSVPPDAVCVEFDDKTWQLKDDMEFIEVPGQSSHGYGLAVRLGNIQNPDVQDWLDKNAEQFGFVREYDFLPSRYVYIKSRQAVPERVLEIENLLPEPQFSAKQIAQACGCRWLKTPADTWSCNGMFYAAPFRAGALAVIDQGNGIGISEKSIRTLFRQCAGFICTQPSDDIIKRNRPILLTSNVNDTIEKLNALFDAAPSEVDAKEAAVDINELQSELNFYKKTNPESVIFQRKKKLAERLLQIPVEELQNAPEQLWYGEYLALLAIRIQQPALRCLAKDIVDKLVARYSEIKDKSERELVVLSLLQFMEPQELPMPFNQHLWTEQMISDVRNVFLNQFLKISYSDDDTSTYWLARQMTWRHGDRKPRIAFLMSSNNKNDKLLPLYSAMRERDDMEVFMIFHPSAAYKHSDRFWNFFHELFPNDKIYDVSGVQDFRRLKPDYVFCQSPYEERRPFPSFVMSDVVRFAKVCHVTYGASIAHTYIDRLIKDRMNFYRNVYFIFCSAETAKEKITAMFSENANMGYQHFEFLGYPVLENVDNSEPEPHSTKRILWTPRWSYNARTGGSHFLEYKDKFVTLRERYGDKVELAMRPHVNTFRDLQDKQLISKEDVVAYKRRLKENEIELYSTFVDLEENFKQSDILLTDYSSIVVVYFLTGRPIIYCDFPNAVMMPEYEEMLECMYVARSWEDVERYLDDLVNGIDPLFERRQKAVEKIRAAHANASTRIIERVLQDFNDCLEDTDV